MAIQDPVMYLTEEIKPDTVYNRDVYKEFVQSGDKVKYVVSYANTDGHIFRRMVFLIAFQLVLHSCRYSPNQ
jgi:hypothetical protein